MCEMASLPTKRLRRSAPSPSPHPPVDIEKCIICQTDQPHLNTTGSDTGTERIVQAASIRKDVVYDRLRQVDNSKIVYHVSNECYKQYTLKKTLDRIGLAGCSRPESPDPSTQQGSSNSDSRSRRSSTASRDSACKTDDVDIFSQKCVICGNAKHNNDYSKYRISEKGRADAFLKAALLLQDEVYTKTSDLQDANAVFGADLYSHKTCIRNYIRKGEKLSGSQAAGQRKLDIFQDVLKDIEPGLYSGKCHDLSFVADRCNMSSNEKQLNYKFTNRDVKMYLISVYKKELSFFSPPGSSRLPTMFFRVGANTPQVQSGMSGGNDCDLNADVLKRCGRLLRQCIMKHDFELDDKFCDSTELEDAYNAIVLPDQVGHFFSGLFDVDIDCDDGEGAEANLEDSKIDSETDKHDKILSVFQVIFFILNNGRKRTPLHMLNSEAVYNACRSKLLVASLNRFGLAVSYDEILRYHSDMASYVIESSQGGVPLPSNFDSKQFTMGAFDNFDHEEATLSGIGGSHDTVMVLMQDKPETMNGKPKRSETNVSHRDRQFKEELSCQVLRKYYKVSKKPTLSTLYEVPEEHFKMNEGEYKQVRAKDVAWVVGRMDLRDDEVGETCEKQTMPSWSAFNSLVTNENLPVKIVGFLPVLPYPVTQHATVYTALKNFQEILGKLEQTHLPVACDEGVYQFARQITMQNPQEFENIVLVLGSFHLIKVLMGAIGKFIDGSGAETILTESKAFGPNVVRSVIDGSHYVRSLKGLMILAESIERLQWARFFHCKGTSAYMDELEMLKLLKDAVSEKDRERSKRLLDRFVDSSRMIDDFNAFRSDLRNNSETFVFWDTFVEMVSILKDLVRADREGNWQLHLQSIQSALPIFAGCDRTNYYRWASVYLEDMRRLQKDAPDVYENFAAGKFSIKRTAGKFNAIGADMCLEQTINRSQKSASGIIGSTKKKKFVAQWEIIYHEMLAVVNIQRQISGVSLPSTELTVGHEFNVSATLNSEKLARDVIEYIKQNENPAGVSEADIQVEQPKLHNILTQEIVSSEIRDDLLNFKTKSSDLYDKFRRERLVKKEKSLFDPIHRNNLKTFKSMKPEKGKQQVGEQESKKLAKAQKIFDIARVRNYDMKELLRHDLIEKSYLFDEKGLMSKPNKSELCKGLEDEHLDKKKDYLPPDEWKKVKTASIVDVMCCLRQINTSSLKTFGDLCARFLQMAYGLSKDSNRIDFVFDTYVEGSVKDSERQRRQRCSPIDLNVICEETPLPVSMDAFWASSANKSKLQGLLRNYVLAHTRPMTDIVLSGIGFSPNIDPCQGIFNGSDQTPVPDLDLDIEEADVRTIPHALNATNCGAERVVLLSNDTDVVVLGLHHWSIMKAHGLKELWIKAGIAATTRYIPLHTLATRMGPEKCKVIIPLHHLTGCDSTSKFGTKAAGLKAKPEKFLQNFARNPYDTDFNLVEEFLVQVYPLKAPSDCQTMDHLRYHVFHHSSKTILDLPPTSRLIRGHIQRAVYVSYMQTHCLDNPHLDPKDFGFFEQDGLLRPVRDQILLPDHFPMPCTCTSCATKRCSCGKRGIRCCPYCQCQASGKGCKNVG